MTYTYLLAAVLCAAQGNPFLKIPQQDRAILSRVAHEYKLTVEQRRLLFAIRLAENGANPKEMGVLVPAAMRYKGNHAKSLELQSRFAAGTIKKRFTGDIDKFSQRWAPSNVANDPTGLNRNWTRNVKHFMQK